MGIHTFQDHLYAPSDSWTLPSHLSLVSGWSARCTNHRKASSCSSNITSVEKAKFMLDGNNIPITLSIGFATCPDDSSDKAGLIEKADQALYWSKGHGRNRCTAYSTIMSEGREKG